MGTAGEESIQKMMERGESRVKGVGEAGGRESYNPKQIRESIEVKSSRCLHSKTKTENYGLSHFAMVPFFSRPCMILS